MSEQATPNGPVVVGVDGSEASLEALRWAVRQGRATGSPVRAVTAWAFPEHPTPFGIVPDLPLPSDPLDEVRARLESTVHAITGDDQAGGVVVEVVAGEAGHVLVDASKHAGLLVVGHRGRSGLAGALIGSVSAHCLHHAACPVVVVRHDVR